MAGGLSSRALSGDATSLYFCLVEFYTTAAASFVLRYHESMQMSVPSLR